MNEHEKALQTIKANHNHEGFAREELQKYADKNNINVGDAFTMILDSIKERCPFNFFGCNDTEGMRVAFDMKDMEEALGKTNLTCQEICNKGCCAYINQILASIGAVVVEKTEDEA